MQVSGQASGSMVILAATALLAACSTTTPAPAPVAANPPPPAPVAVASPIVPTPPKASDELLTIDFDNASTTLSPTARAQLDGAARLYRDAHPEIMIVSGHSDKSGSEFSNLVLSARRADTVKKALVDRGVPSDRLEIVAIGEAQPVPTVQASRSAVVTWR